jgi:hypothetical protein
MIGSNGPRFSWQIGTTQLTEYDADGFLGLQVDSMGEAEEGGMDALDAIHPFGFEGRHLDPEQDATGGLSLYTFEGDDGYAIALGDYRLVSKLPELKKGGSRWYCATGSYGVFDGDDGTLTFYIPYAVNADGVPTKAHLIQIGLDSSGAPVIDLGSGEGPRLSMVNKSITLANAAGDAYFELNDNGGILNGNYKVTGAFDIGAASFPLAKAPELLVWATTVTAALAALGVTVPPLPASVATAFVKGF